MVAFIPANELKKKFDVFGHFYSININSENSIDCRSVLEIINKDNNVGNHDSISSMLPDAILVMMNPGSSKPLIKTPISFHMKIQGISISRWSLQNQIQLNIK
jgi:hypothetical protein